MKIHYCYYRYAPAKDVSHSIACNVNSFGDPAPGIGKVFFITTIFIHTID